VRPWVRKSIATQAYVDVQQALSSRDGGTLRTDLDAAGELAPRTYWRSMAYASRAGQTDGGYDPQHASGLLGVQRARSPEYYDNSSLQAPKATNWDAGLLYQVTPTAAVYAGTQYAIEVDGRFSDFQLYNGTEAPLRKQRRTQAGTKLELLDRRPALTIEPFACVN